MKVLLTGACGFVGSTLARCFREHRTAEALSIVGLDNLARAGSESNREHLRAWEVSFRHGDVRLASDLEGIGPVDWVIDAAANPSVLAGVDGQTSSRQLLEHNLGGTINLLEYARAHGAGLILLSTSRVYSMPPLAALPMEWEENAFHPRGAWPPGMSAEGVAESFSTAPPVSLYGATKVASETLALEYHHAYGLPVWVNRCGVLAGEGQFGHPAQGIFAYWLHAHLRRRPLRYLGFDGRGGQVRDCLHPEDLATLLLRQMEVTGADARARITNVSGGRESAMSLAQLTSWCDARFGPHPVEAAPEKRPFDLPWLVLDSAQARREWGWSPAVRTPAILERIARHAEAHPEWLELSRG